jgi:cation:H+ antiporter
MITAVVASGRHRPGLAAGDAIGANLLTLILALAALARPLPFGGRSGHARPGRPWPAAWPRS